MYATPVTGVLTHICELVLAARIPEDTEEERGLVYFKKYVKVRLVLIFT